MNQNSVSIIVPCYNQAQYLDECLESVLAQTFQDWECIIVNDGSTDNTQEISKNWIEKDNRFKYIYKQNSGLSAARNTGIENAIGEFILPLDADDKIASEYCKLAIEEFKKDLDLKVVYCNAEKFGEETGEWILGNFSLEALAKFNLIFCSAIFKKTDCHNVGGFDVKMVYGLEDWEFWIAILKNGGNVKKIEQVCFFYRVKKDSMVTELKDEKLKYSYEYMSIKHVDFFVKHLGSFKSLLNEIKIHNENIKSEKFIINLFFNRFFGFKFFKKKTN